MINLKINNFESLWKKVELKNEKETWDLKIIQVYYQIYFLDNQNQVLLFYFIRFIYLSLVVFYILSFFILYKNI